MDGGCINWDFYVDVDSVDGNFGPVVGPRGGKDVSLEEGGAGKSGCRLR